VVGEVAGDFDVVGEEGGVGEILEEGVDEGGVLPVVVCELFLLYLLKY